MVQRIVRVVVAIGGAFLLFLAGQLWLDPTGPAEGLGVAALNGLGTATLRADLGAFFATTGIFCLAAAVLNKGRLMTAPLLLFGLALSGRLLTVLLDGRADGALFPMVVEISFLAIFLAGRVSLETDP